MKEFYEKIEAYNLGKLSPAEAAQLEAAMSADSQLASAVQQHRAEWEAKELLAEKMLRAQIRHQFEQQPQSSKNWFSRNWKWLVPVVVALFGAVWYFMKNDQPAGPTAPTTTPSVEWPSPEKVDTPAVPIQVPPTNTPIAGTETPPAKPDWGALAAASYTVPESLGGLRGEDGDTLSLAATAFSQKKYRQVVQLLTPLPDESQQEALILRAHAQFSAKNYAAAARDFSELENGGIYKKEGEWYGLLARMASGKFAPKGDGKILDGIRSNERHPHSADALALYKKLKAAQ
jgi:hypothetical protein